MSNIVLCSSAHLEYQQFTHIVLDVIRFSRSVLDFVYFVLTLQVIYLIYLALQS